MISAERADTVEKDDLETIRERIRDRMQALRVSGREVSRKAGLGLSYVNDLLSGASSRPGQMNLSRVADALKCDIEYLIGEQSSVRASPEKKSALSNVGANRRSIAQVESLRVPLYSSPWTDGEGFFSMSEEPVEMTPVAFEPVAGSYAVVIPDDLMAPRYFIGEKVFVNPRRPIMPGSFAVVRMKDGRAFVRKIVESTLETVVCATFAKSGENISIPRDEIESVHRITAASEA